MHVREVLSNGVRLLTVPSDDTRALTVLVLIGVGSRHEPSRIAGAAHFIEHMLFKGTERWKTAGRISRELDAVGADYNAFTSKELTGYHIRVQAGRAPLAVAMMHEMIARPLFAGKEIERERGVILEEIAMYEDAPSALAHDRLEELMYRCALGRNIAGTRATVSRMRQRDLLEFKKRFYRTDRMVVALAGDVHAGIADAVRSTFGSIPRAKARPSAPPCGIAAAGEPKFALTTKDTEQVHAALGLPGLPYGHRMRPALSLMATVLGCGMSSRLFTEVRERRGLAYSIYAATGSYTDVGDVTIHAGFAKDKIDQGLRTVMQELGRMARSGVTASELKRAKAFLEGGLVLSLESPHHLAEAYARQELFMGAQRTIDERIAALEAVTISQVHAVARKLIRSSRLFASIVGPYDDEARFRKLLKIPYA